MARQPRAVVVGVPHHVTQRGNNRQRVFLTDEDRLFYLDTLRRKCGDHSLRVLGYCLMSNHVHLVATPQADGSLARALGQTHHAHARRFNALGRRSGRLWQNRFYSCPLGPNRLADALAYVDLNPCRACIVERAEDYRWSSAAAHVSHTDRADLLDLWTWTEIDPNRDWREFLASKRGPTASDRLLRQAVRHGTPFGDALFVSEIETRLGRRLRPHRNGSPRTLPRRIRREQLTTASSLAMAIRPSDEDIVTSTPLLPGSRPSGRLRKAASQQLKIFFFPRINNFPEFAPAETPYCPYSGTERPVHGSPLNGSPKMIDDSIQPAAHENKLIPQTEDHLLAGQNRPVTHRCRRPSRA